MRRLALCLLTLVLPAVLCAAPAEDHFLRKVGPRADHTAVIPLNWALTPVGDLIEVGEMPYGGVLSPDGRWFAVSNNGQGEQALTLIEVGTKSGAHARKVHLVMPRAKGGLYWGLVFSPDGSRLYAAGGGCNRVWVYDLSHEPFGDPQPISMVPPAEPEKKPEATDPSKYAGGKANPVSKKDFFPAGLALSPDGKRLYVANVLEGAVAVVDTDELEVVARINVARFPYAVCTNPGGDRLYVSRWADHAVAVVDAKAGAVIKEIPTGDHPCAFANNPKLAEVYCANSNSDTVTIISTKDDTVVGTIDVHPYAGSPAGSCPNALAVTPDGTRLYVANAGNNDVAVVDLATRKVTGLIPTAWYPSAVAVARDGSELYTVSAKGLGAGPNMPPRRRYIANMLHGIVSIVQTPNALRLARYTHMVSDNNELGQGASVRRAAGSPKCAIPRLLGDKSPIKHVFYFIKENRTYDQVLGDMPQGNGDPSLTLFGKEVSPNHHAIASEFVLLDNLYADSTVSVDGHEWCKAANVSDAFEKTWPANYGQRGPLIGGPVKAPTAGYIWDSCKRSGKLCKIYGGPIARKADQGVAEVVVRDIKKAEETDSLPDLMLIHLPCDHTMGTSPGQATPRAMVADNDLALGRIVGALAKSKFWAESAVFAVEDDAQDGPDHVDAHRTVALIAGPYVRRGIVDSTCYDQCSIVRTIELILGLQPMSQFDAAATPMYASFQDTPDLRPYECKAATWNLDETNSKTAYGAAECLAMDWSEVDRAPWPALNRILWFSIKGENVPFPEIKIARRTVGMDDDDDDD